MDFQQTANIATLTHTLHQEGKDVYTIVMDLNTKPMEAVYTDHATGLTSKLVRVKLLGADLWLDYDNELVRPALHPELPVTFEEASKGITDPDEFLVELNKQLNFAARMV